MDGTRNLNIDGELLIYGPIDSSSFWGDEVRAVDVMSSLASIEGDEVVVRINSPGGSVYEGLAIYNALKADPRKVTVRVEAIAASIASVIAMAGDEIEIADSASFMIHDPWTVIAGDSDDLRAMADELERMKGIAIDIYARRTGMKPDEISALMSSETYFGAERAIEMGFATKVSAGAKIDARMIPRDRLESIVRNEIAARMGSAKQAAPAATRKEMAKMPEKTPAAPAENNAPAVAQAVDVEAIRAQEREAAIVAERSRVSAINLACRNARLGSEFAEDLVARGVSIADAHAAVINAIADRTDRTEGPEARNVVVSRDATQTRLDAMSEALAIRLGVRGEPSAAAREYMELDLVEMAAERVGHRGRLNNVAVRENVLRMAFHTTGDFPIITENAMNRALAARYALVEPTYRMISKRRTYVDFRDHISVSGGDFPTLSEVKESGEITGGTMGEKKESTAVKAYAVQVGVSRKLLVNDSLGAIQSMLASRADTVAAFEEATFYAMMLSNSAAGPTLVETARGVFNTTDKTKASSGGAIDVTTLGAARAAMRKKTSVDGTLKLNISPKILLVGPDYENLALQYTSSAFVPNQSSVVNPFSGALQVIVTPQITGNAWYVFADPSAGANFEWGLLQGYEAPRFRIEEPFGVQGMSVSLEHDFGCGAIDYRFGWLNAGA